MTLLVNTLLLFLVADFVITPFFDTATDLVFTRVGSVYPDRIKIVARYPFLNGTENGDIRVVYRQLDGPTSETWKDGPVMNFTKEFDWVDTVTLRGLWPSTFYECEFHHYSVASILADQETDTLLASNDTPIVTRPIGFRTFPDPRLPTGHRFRFLVSSCILPNFPYRGPMHRRTIKGFDLVTDYLFSRPNRKFSQHFEPGEASDTSAITSDVASETPSPMEKDKREDVPLSSQAEFLLFLGDFIYADVPMYTGDTKEDYRRLYRRNYLSDSFRKLYEKLRKYCTLLSLQTLVNDHGDSCLLCLR
jgi:alkaline phosphatase D